MHSLRYGFALLVVAGASALAADGASDLDWPQWGGPARNFCVRASGLADRWPSSGPPVLWKHEMGDGYSAIVARDGALYTMCRSLTDDQREMTIALDAATGKTLWRHGVAAPITTQDDSDWGGWGPNATPLIVGHRLFSVGSRGLLQCFDRTTGQVLWKHDLHAEYDASVSNTVGYSNSPIEHAGLLIVAVGRDEAGSAKTPTLMAFDQDTGEAAWRALDHERGFSSPIVIRFSEHDLVVFASSGGLAVVNPEDGRLLWQRLVRGRPMTTPAWNGRDLLYWTPRPGGEPALAVRLKVEDGAVSGEEAYDTRKGAFEMATPVRVGDLLIGSTRQNLVAVDFETGRRKWIARGYPMAACVHADGKLIILDENGQLTLATATPERLRVHSQCHITERYSFTAPTLVGTTLFVRDRKHIMALDLSQGANGE